MIAAYLDLPYVGGVSAVEVADNVATVTKEFAGGEGAKYAIELPAVIGVQAAAKPPRYAPISKVRQVAQSATIEKVSAEADGTASGLTIRQIAPPVSTGHAEMLTGSSKDVAARLVELLKSKGLA
jgi:electron transfer flavoprotein beta subunit